MSQYGIPYMGSKSKICDKVCKLFPKADHFYDLFGGGFSVTDYMLRHRPKDYKEFHFNEIRSGMIELIQDAIAGKYSYDVYKPEFVTREMFFERLDKDILVKIIWSFGNSGKCYLFGKDIESYKSSLHSAIVFNDFDNTAKEVFGCDKFRDNYTVNDRRLYLRNRIKQINPGKRPTELQQLRQLEQLERLERLERLQKLEKRHSLFFHNKSYDQIDIKPNSVVYCDIPYVGTGEYDGNKSFSHKKFYEWADSQENPVFISEYSLPDERFKCVAMFDKRSQMDNSGKKALMKKEKVFVNKTAYSMILKQMKRSK